MLLFSTLLNINDNFTREKFIDLVTEWNQGTRHAENYVSGVTWNGESNVRFGTDKLSVEIVDYPEKDILAVRYEKITDDDVIWDTDFIVNFSERKIAIRLDRTFSEEALEMDAAFSTPHFISLLVRHGYLQPDHGVPVLREPIFFTDQDIDMIWSVLTDIESFELPVVYVTKDYNNQDPVDISRLASRLKGAAHILVEESKFSCLQCAALCNETSEGYGAIKIYYPSPGVNRKRFLYRRTTGNMDVRLEKVIQHVIKYWNSQRTDPLYTWQGVNRAVMAERLQKQSLKLAEEQHARLNAEKETSLLYDTFDEEIKSLQKKLNELSKQNEILQMENYGLRAKLDARDTAPVIYHGEEKDFYPDEIKDMVLGILTDARNHTEKGTRLFDVLEDILEYNLYQHLSDERKQRVKNLLKGGQALTGAVKRELMSMGFQIMDEGKHYKLTYRDDPRYMVTISKTPSDPRSGSNCAGLINKIML